MAGILTSARTILDAGSLTVWNLDVSDQGVYECVASNVIGDVITSTLLVVERQWFSRRFSRLSLTFVMTGRLAQW